MTEETAKFTDNRSQQHDGAERPKALAWIAPLMFSLSILFLLLIAAALVLRLDVDRVVDPIDVLDETNEPTISAEEFAFQQSAHGYGDACLLLMLCMWPAFVLEQIWNRLQETSFADFRLKHPYWWIIPLFPPLRMCANRYEEAPKVWLPWLGWQTANRKLRKRLEKKFSLPMILIALLILPVLGLQFIFKDRIVDYPVLRIFLHIGTGLIWFAFTVEFIVMVSVARNKWSYCKQHWLDLAIILLPLISFLRSLRVLRLSQLVKGSRLAQLSKMVRVYRLRGVAMRAFRAILVLEVIHRLLRTKPESRIASLVKRRNEMLRELQDIDEQIDEIKKQQALAEAASSDSPESS